jgi:hypothetical protein
MHELEILMTRFLSLLVVLCLAAGSADASSMISYSWLSSSYSPRDIAYAGGPGELWTEVAGNPFLGTKGDFDRIVTGSMYGAHFGPPTKFTTTPGPNARRNFHVRLLFNGTATDQGAICNGPPQSIPGAPGGSVVLYAAFCQDNDALSFLRAAGDFSGPGDPAFTEFMHDVTMKLFPSQNNELFKNNNDCHQWSC